MTETATATETETETHTKVSSSVLAATRPQSCPVQAATWYCILGHGRRRIRARSHSCGRSTVHSGTQREGKGGRSQLWNIQ
eukprot:2195615-Rhodomonas_salina.1